MDRVPGPPDFIEIKGVFTDLQKRENLGRKKKKEKRKSFLLAIIFT